MPSWKSFGLALLTLLLASSALEAHDFWIEPSTFTPAAGQRVPVRLRVGEHFRGDPVPRNLERMERFAALGDSGDLPVEGVPNTDPAGHVSFKSPGLQLLVYDSDRASIELAGPKFEEYLKEEGLTGISALRAERGESAAGAKEVYSRCAKTLVAVGGNSSGKHDRIAGLPLELVPEKNPYALTGGGELPVRLLYQGKPLEGALVTALQKGRAGEAVSARSDRKGQVSLRLDRPGAWLVKAVHMIPAPKEAGADWESFWASLTFEIPASP